MLKTLRRTKAYKTMPQAAHYPVKKTPMLPEGCFDGKVAFITGGGTGLGKGMATNLSKLGATVAITGRREVFLKNKEKIINNDISPSSTRPPRRSQQFLEIQF